MRRVILTLVMAILVTISVGLAGLPVAASGLVQVTLNCDDGTSMTTVVDTDTVNSLIASVQALLDYPAGLSCTLTQLPLPSPLGGVAIAASSDMFVVGGGRWVVTCVDAFHHGPGGTAPTADSPAASGSFFVNIAVNGQAKSDGTFLGTLDETIPEHQSCDVTVTNPDGTTTTVTIAVGASHFTSKLGAPGTCVSFNTATFDSRTVGQAYVTSLVTEVTGPATFPVGSLGGTPLTTDPATYVRFGFQDNGQPSTAADWLNGIPRTPSFGPSTPPDCNSHDPDPAPELANGNITVRQ